MKNASIISFLFLLTIIYSSCKVNKNIIGDYSARDFGKWHLKIESNNSFQFVGEDYKAVYAKKEPFFQTTGVWLRRGDSLLLNSKPSKSEILNFTIDTLETTASESTFMFFDSYGDTITFINVFKNRILFLAKFHGNYSKIDAKVLKEDFFEFDFSDTYNPFSIKIQTDNPKIYQITLARKERTDYFKDYIFLIKNGKLMDPTQKRKYKKTE